MFIRAFFFVLGWGGEQFGAGSSFIPSEPSMLQFLGVLSANLFYFFSSAHIPKSFLPLLAVVFLFFLHRICILEGIYVSCSLLMYSLWPLLLPLFMQTKSLGGGSGEKEQRIGCMCKLWMEQMGFMKITVGRINRTDDSRCQSIHANTF